MKVGLWINEGEQNVSFDKASETEAAEVFINVIDDYWLDMIRVAKRFYQQDFLLRAMYDSGMKKKIAKKKGKKK